MSKDIRSYFTLKKDGTKKPPEKPHEKQSEKSHTKRPEKSPKRQPEKSPKKPTRALIISSSDDDDIIIKKSPAVDLKQKTKQPQNRKRKIIESSDSETEDKKKPSGPRQSVQAKVAEKLKNDKEKRNLKTITPLEMFGKQPVKQTEIPKKKEAEVHSDDDFEKTLQQLDEDELVKLKKFEDNHMKKEENRLKKIKDENEKKHASDRSELNISMDTALDDSIIEPTPQKKRKHSSSDNHDQSNADPDEERYEKKRHCAVLYQKYLNRTGPKNPGSKEIPKGKPGCLKGLVFIVTGVLESLERDEANSIIIDLGGKISSGVTSKVTYMVMGDDAGPAKVEKARKFGTKIISEDELLELIRTKSDETSDSSASMTKLEEFSKPEKKKTTPAKKDHKNEKATEKKHKSETQIKVEEVSPFFSKTDDDKKPIKIENTPSEKKLVNGTKPAKHRTETLPQSSSDSKVKREKTPEKVPVTLAWVDKYKPQNIKQIVGQQGENSNMKKLLYWLQNWYKNRSPDKKHAKPSPWAKNDDGAYFKAALLSGPPGIGKTTTATLVCRELGYDAVEFNASDTRNKKLLHEEVGHLLKNKTIAGFYNNGGAPSKKRVLLMDEVDGMSGNEDRGGMQELINLIKDTSIPIVCMCNDRNHPKVRSLANYCFDLRFSKPRVEQIRAAMLSMCYKENVTIRPDVLDKIIIGTENDLRQTINHLALWSVESLDMGSDDTRSKVESLKKNVKLGPWEVVKKVFSAEEHKNMSIHDKSDLFFYDYSIGPLFVQENYLNVAPHVPRNQWLDRVADAADSLSMGDLVDARIRGSNSWSLLPLMAICTSVAPGAAMSGHVSGQINFPAWLGKNSRRSKFRRMLSELQVHMRLSISGSQDAVNLDYLPHVRDSILRPLGKEQIDDALSAMHTYNLLREDLDNICELSTWPKLVSDPLAAINGKVKAAFTRAYNKDSATLPYAIASGPVKKRAAAIESEDALLAGTEDVVEDSEPDDDDVSHDAMIKAKKPTAASKNASAKPKKDSKGPSSKKAAAGPSKPRAKKK